MPVFDNIEQTTQSLPYKLAEEFSQKTNRCLFITGKAGTGKTTFLKRLRETSPKNMAVVAPTGVAAINAGGMTIHSFFQLPIRTLVPTPESYRQMFAEQRMMQRKRQMLYHLEMLVIDEISMVRADVLDAIDAVLRHYKYRRDLPFGGVQVVMIGDLMQLSPVVHGDDGVALAKYYNGPYFFQSRVMQELQPVYIELDHVFRQQNEQFVRLLNEVRDNRLSAESRTMLASRYLPDFKNEEDNFHITLTTHNRQADDLNQRKLDELPGRLYKFKAEVFKNFPESSYPTDETLLLKEGARVMFIKNDDQKPRRFYNGKLGIVKHVNGADSITVQCDDGDIEVEPVTWENIRYREDAETGKITEEMLGAFRQFPLRLAWAITIHKSQGLTFDRVIIDAARAFAAGQVYVALSRCRALEGIVLSSPLQNVSLSNDRQVLDYVNAQPSTEQAGIALGQAEKEYKLQLLTDLFSVTRLQTLIEQMQKHVAKCVSFNAATMPFLDELKKEICEQAGVSDKFQGQLKSLVLSDSNDLLQERLKAAAGYFVPKLAMMAAKLNTHPCRCKNKEDVGDFDTMMGDLFLTLTQKAALMQVMGRDASIDAFLKAKSRFVAPQMETSAFEKPQIKSKRTKTASHGQKRTPLPKKQLLEKEHDEPITSEKTFELYAAGNTIKQIATLRGLTTDTVVNHLLIYVKRGQILVTDIVPTEILNRILAARAEYPSFTTLKEFYDTLGGEVPYPYLKTVLEGFRLL
ncbi:MAG: AAA family ATPase [Paludibacteraceae bacterium]|nr:AAA family ATPase [Paludibacteraceae bacterium]